MGIYIPNVEKPKSCYNHCNFIAMEEVGCPLKDYAESHQYKDRIHPDCPLIDIVTCGECIWKEECTITELWGGRGFCPSGERRTE